MKSMNTQVDVYWNKTRIYSLNIIICIIEILSPLKLYCFDNNIMKAFVLCTLHNHKRERISHRTHIQISRTQTLHIFIDIIRNYYIVFSGIQNEQRIIIKKKHYSIQILNAYGVVLNTYSFGFWNAILDCSAFRGWN